MIIVVDASAAYDLLTEGKCAGRIANAEELISPDLIVCELLNARWKVARSRERAPSVETILEFLDRLRILPSLRYAATAAGFAERLDHPVYDCLYVAAAHQENAKLLTADQRLRQKLRTHTLSRLLQ